MEERRRLLVLTGGGTEMEKVGKDQKARCEYLESIALDLEQ